MKLTAIRRRRAADGDQLLNLTSGGCTLVADRCVQRITLAPRLTEHVRHREKNVAVPVADERAFYVTPNSRRAALDRDAT